MTKKSYAFAYRARTPKYLWRKYLYLYLELIKKHLFVEVSNDPINGPTVSGGTSFTPDKPLISSSYN